MSEQMEDIQARLTAYIDGELAGSEREEIERHLAANPSHLALVQDLMRQRQVLRGLPRETAPADLMEELQGQLERETLLGGEEPLAEQTRLTIRPWPQILSVAAIFLLAIGLGFLIYRMVPRGEPRLATNSTPPSGADATRPTEDPESAAGGARSALDEGRDKDLEPGPRMKLAARGGAGGFGASRTGGNLEPMVDRGAEHPAVRSGSEPTPLAVGNAVDASVLGTQGAPTDLPAGAAAVEKKLYITVTANDLDQANTQVVRFLEENRIAWSEAKGEATDENAVAEPENKAFAFGGPAAEMVQATESLGMEKNRRSVSRGGMAKGADNEPSPALRESPEAEKSVGQREAEAPARRDMRFGGGGAPGAVQMAGRRNTADLTPAGPAVEGNDGVRTGSTASARVILARNMSVRQVTDLTTALSRPDRGELAVVSKMERRATGQAVQLHDTLEQTQQGIVNGVSGDGSHDMAMAAQKPATQPAIGSLAANLPIQASAPDPLTRDAAGSSSHVVVGTIAVPTPADAMALQPKPGAAEGPYVCIIVLQNGPAAPATRPAAAAPQAEPPATQPAAK